MVDQPVEARGGPVDPVVVDAFLASGPLPDAARRVLQAVAEVLGWERAELWAVSSLDGSLVLAASWSSQRVRATTFDESTLGRAFASGEGLPGRVWVSGEPLWIEDLSSAAWLPRHGAATAAGLRSALAFPVYDGPRVCGVVALFGSGPEPTPTQREQLPILGGLLGHLLVRKRSEERRAVAEAQTAHLVEDLRRLHDLEVRLLASDDLASMLSQVLEAAVEIQGATAGVLMLHDPEHDDLYCVASTGFSDDYLATVGRVPVGEGACGAAAAEQRGVLIEDVSVDPLFARYRDAAARGGYRSVYSLPLRTSGGKLLGTLAMYFPMPHVPPERERWLVALYATQASEAIRHSQLLEQTREAQETRDASLARLRRQAEQLKALNEAALAVNACATLDDTLAEATRRARSVLGTHLASTTILQGPDWSHARSARDRSARAERCSQLDTPPDGTTFEALVRETNTLLRLTQPELAAHPRWRGSRRHGAGQPPNGLLAAPLTAADGSNCGVIQVADKDAGDFSAEDEAVLVQLAQITSVAVRNAQLLAERTQTAQTLQRSLLPPSLPRLPLVTLAARFHPVSGAQVGGDFYDVFQLGRNDWAVVIGDVCGKGTAAASLTALVRYTIRAGAMASRRPSDILAHLNTSMLRQAEGAEPRFATVAYARLRLAPGRVSVTVACAGHPPPLLRRVDGTVVPVRAPGTVVGAIEDVEFTQRSVRLGPGDTLLLYTDGITEARTASGMFEERLAATLAASPTPEPEGLLDHLDATLNAQVVEPVRDDIAALAIHRPAAGDA